MASGFARFRCDGCAREILGAFSAEDRELLEGESLVGIDFSAAAAAAAVGRATAAAEERCARLVGAGPFLRSTGTAIAGCATSDCALKSRAHQFAGDSVAIMGVRVKNGAGTTRHHHTAVAFDARRVTLDAYGLVVELADTTDSKSVARKGVRVRVSPRPSLQ